MSPVSQVSERFCRFALVVLSLSVVGGCAAGIGTLVAWLVSDDGGSTTVIQPQTIPLISSIEPRESSVVGGIDIVIQGRNFDAQTLVSIAGRAAESVAFDSQALLHSQVCRHARACARI